MTVRDVCDVAHAVLLEEEQRVAIADRQAELGAALVLRVEDYMPISIASRVADWEAWLATEPVAPPTPETFADRVARFEQQVNERDQMTEVA